MSFENQIFFGDWADCIGGIPPGAINLVLTDPPYESTPCDWDKRPSWTPFMDAMGRLCGDSGQMWIFTRPPWCCDILLAGYRTGWSYVQEVIWEKQNAGGCTVGTFRKVHENIWHFKRPKARTFNLEAVRVPKLTDGNKSVRKRASSATQFIGALNSSYVDDGLRIPRSVVYCRNLHRSEESLGHPTQKPLEVVLPLVLYSSNPGDMVFDPYCGTGTSLAAAKTCGRRWSGAEKDPEWHKVATRRLELTVYEPSVGIARSDREAQGDGDLFGE